MNLGVRVRDLAAADVDAAVTLAASLKDAPHWPPAVYQAALQADAQPRRVILVAEDGESRFVGLAVALLIPPEAELESIAVAVHAQRLGVGRQLLTELVGRLQQYRVEQLHLEVRASNRAAQAFYGASGFLPAGVRPRYYADPSEDAILMQRQVL